LDNQYMGDDGTQGPITQRYSDGGQDLPFTAAPSWGRNAGIEEFGQFKNTEGVFIEFDYFYPIPSATSDFVEPSRYKMHTDHEFGTPHTAGADYVADLIPLGGVVFRDSSEDSVGAGLQPPPIEEKYWNLNPKRAGKLLPYRYTRLTIGVPLANQEPTAGIDVAALNGRVASDPSVSQALIFDSRGVGFATGDLIGFEAYGVTIGVATTDADGVILSVTGIDPGADIPFEEFAGSGNLADSTANGGLRLEIINSTGGTDLDAYFLTGKVITVLNTDPKPYIVKNNGQATPIRLTGNKSENEGGTGRTSAFESNAFANEQAEVEILIAAGDRSANNQYNAFLHFHNDVSFCWLAGGSKFAQGFPHGNADNVAETHESFIHLDIKAT
jgi:hypothetical protein